MLSDEQYEQMNNSSFFFFSFFVNALKPNVLDCHLSKTKTGIYSNLIESKVRFKVFSYPNI